jgi:hypothetical protein
VIEVAILLAATHDQVSKDAFPNARRRQARQMRLIGEVLDASCSRPAAMPDVGLYATLKRLRRPRLADGFDELFAVRFDGRGGFDVRPLEE